MLVQAGHVQQSQTKTSFMQTNNVNRGKISFSGRMLNASRTCTSYSLPIGLPLLISSQIPAIAQCMCCIQHIITAA